MSCWKASYIQKFEKSSKNLQNFLMWLIQRETKQSSPVDNIPPLLNPPLCKIHPMPTPYIAITSVVKQLFWHGISHDREEIWRWVWTEPFNGEFTSGFFCKFEVTMSDHFLFLLIWSNQPRRYLYLNLKKKKVICYLINKREQFIVIIFQK